MSNSNTPMPLGDAMSAILEVLRGLDEESKDGLWSEDVLSKVHAAACELASLPAEIQHDVVAADGLRLLLEAIVRVRVPDPPEAGVIETIGWLEAPFDPASKVIAPIDCWHLKFQTFLVFHVLRLKSIINLEL